MVEVATVIISFLVSIAPQYQVLGVIFTAVGFIYASLVALRGTLTAVAKVTKTDKDNKFFNAVFAFLDKYGVAFHKVETYAESQEKKDVSENT